MNYDQQDDSMTELKGVSKYFSRLLNTSSQEKQKRQPKKMVDRKISEFFSAKHPNMKVLRTANKIRFDVS